MNFNLGDSHVLLEDDEVKLDRAIRISLSNAQKAFQLHYLPTCEIVPTLDKSVGYGKKNAAQAVFHFLDCSQGVRLGENYLDSVNRLLSQPSGEEVDIDLVLKLAFGDQQKIRRFCKSCSYVSLFKNAYRLLMLSLYKQNIIVLAPSMSKYLPSVSHISVPMPSSLGLMPEAVSDMCALHYTGINSLVDWSNCTYIMSTLSKESRIRLVQLSLCTTWREPKDINKEGILEILNHVPVRVIGYFLTYLCITSLDERDLTRIFEIVGPIPYLKIYTKSYESWAWEARLKYLRKKRLRHSARPNSKGSPPQLKELLDEVIQMSLVQEKLDDSALAERLHSLPKRQYFLDINNWPKDTVLPDYIEFDWRKGTRQWVLAMQFYVSNKNYEDIKRAVYKIVPFIYYLNVYLPVYFNFNKATQITYPQYVSDFKGAFFVSRPSHIIIDGGCPMTYADFLRTWYSKHHKLRIYDGMRELSAFFQHIIARKEILGIPEIMVNPVLPSDVPPSGGRRFKTDKTRMPDKVYWLCLLYCYKLYDFLKTINQKILANQDLVYDVNRWCRHTETEHPYLLDIRKLKGISFERTIRFEGREYEVTLVPVNLFHPFITPTKYKGQVRILHPHKLIHNLTALETGLRNHHIQWLDINFDQYVTVSEVQPQELYPLRVNTDKTRTQPWTPAVAGRVIQILRDQKSFREMLKGEVFNTPVPYGGNPNSKWGAFHPLFAINGKNGFPHCDAAYQDAFKACLIGLQEILPAFDVDYLLYEIRNDTDKNDDDADDAINVHSNRCCNIKTEITPHSARVTVVSLNCQYLPPEYVGSKITGQTPSTVGYYNKLELEQIEKLQQEHKQGISVFKRESMSVTLGNGPATIHAAHKTSRLIKAFEQNPHQAATNFGAVSSHFFDRETGLSIITSNANIKFAFEMTQICPFGNVCPKDQVSLGYEKRCFFCDYAIRTVDHLPALACERRNLLEELESIERFIKDNKDKLTDKHIEDATARRCVISEDLAGIEYAESILNNNLKKLQSEQGNGVNFQMIRPEAVERMLQSVPFPGRNEGVKYVIARLNEVNAFPSLHNDVIKFRIASLKPRILANTGNIREALMCENENIDAVVAEVYSLVKNIMNVYSYSQDDIVRVLNKDVTEIVQFGVKTVPLLMSDTDGNESVKTQLSSNAAHIDG